MPCVNSELAYYNAVERVLVDFFRSYLIPLIAYLYFVQDQYTTQIRKSYKSVIERGFYILIPLVAFTFCGKPENGQNRSDKEFRNFLETTTIKKDTFYIDSLGYKWSIDVVDDSAKNK